MGIHTKKPDHMINSSCTSYSLNSLSFSGYLTSKDRQQQQPDSGPVKTRDQGFECGRTGRVSSVSVSDHGSGKKALVLPRLKQSQIDHNNDGQRLFAVRNNSIRRGGQRIREEEESLSSSSSSSGWSVFLSFVSPCRECRATKPNVIQPRRPIQ